MRSPRKSQITFDFPSSPPPPKAIPLPMGSAEVPDFSDKSALRSLVTVMSNEPTDDDLIRAVAEIECLPPALPRRGQ